MLNQRAIEKHWRKHRKPPIFVIGVGRCGTSIIAGMLFKLGVHMGEMFLRPDKFNPTGYYEDMQIANLDINYINGKIDRDEWVETLQKTISLREKNKRWGWKTLSLGLLIDEFVDIVPDAQFIWCRRNMQNTIVSYAKLKSDFQYGFIEQLLPSVESHIISHLPANRTLIVDYEGISGQTVDELIDFCKLTPTLKEKNRALAHLLAPIDGKIRIIGKKLL